MGLFEKQLPHYRMYYAIVNAIIALFIGVIGIIIIVALYGFNKDKFLNSYGQLRDQSDYIF